VRGQPFGIVGQKYAANQILTGCNWAPGIGALVPDLPESEALSRIERKESEGAEKCLTSKPGPDDPAPWVGYPEISGWGPPQELKRHRHFAGIGDSIDERHRFARTDAGRCLQSQTDLSILRRRLSGSSGPRAPW
jgi:hypothetical protein